MAMICLIDLYKAIGQQMSLFDQMGLPPVAIMPRRKHKGTVQIKASTRVNPRTGEITPVTEHHRVMELVEELKQQEAAHETTEENKITATNAVAEIDGRTTGQSVDSGLPELGGGTSTGRYAGDRIQTGREVFNQYPQEDHISGVLPRLVDASEKIHLKQHQADAVNLAIEKFKLGSRGFILADGTGAGKTMQELAIAAVQSKRGKTVLIVTDSERVINNAFMVDAKLLGIEIINDPNATPTPGKIFITTYSRLDKLGAGSWDQLVLDECHNMKNASKKTERCKKLIHGCTNALLASATPMDKGEHIHYLCTTFGIPFRQAMSDMGYEQEQIRTGQGTVTAWKRHVSIYEAAGRIGAFYDQLTSLGLMVKREVPLSNVGFNAVNIELTSEQRAEYAAQVSKAERCIANAKNRGTEKGRCLLSLRRYLEGVKVSHAITEAVKQVAEGNQVVLFMTRVNDAETLTGNMSPGTIKIFEQAFKKLGIPFSAVYGESKNAAKSMDDFNAGKTKIFLTTPESGGTGINLDDTTGQSPRTQIHMTPPFSATVFIQMIGRTNRISTKSPTKVISLYTDTAIDEWNKNIIGNKLKILGSAVSGDYEQLTIEDISRVSTMEESDIFDFILKRKKIRDIKDISIPVMSSHRISSLDGLRSRMERGTGLPTTATPTSPVAEKQMPRQRGEHGLVFDDPRVVNTYQGKRQVRNAVPTQAFWQEWRRNKEKLKEEGYSVSPDRSGGWQVAMWSAVRKSLLQNAVGLYFTINPSPTNHDIETFAERADVHKSLIRRILEREFP